MDLRPQFRASPDATNESQKAKFEVKSTTTLLLGAVAVTALLAGQSLAEKIACTAAGNPKSGPLKTKTTVGVGGSKSSAQTSALDELHDLPEVATCKPCDDGVSFCNEDVTVPATSVTWDCAAIEPWLWICVAKYDQGTDWTTVCTCAD